MKSMLGVFAKTLDQVCAQARDRFGDDVLPSGLKAASMALVISAAATAAQAQAQVEYGDAPQAQTTQVTDADGRHNGNTVARVAGGIAGAVLGSNMTKGAGGLMRAVGILGMGYLGQTAGDILTRDATDQNGRPVTQAGYDAQGRPVYKTIDAPSAKVNRGSYEDAISRASAPLPVHAGGNKLALDAQTHSGLYALMVDAAASRIVARQANVELDRAELARAVAPRDPARAGNFSRANREYAEAFQAYSASYRQVSEVLSIADRNGFDVSAQKTLMAVVPADLRMEAAAPIDWPGVHERVREMHSAQTTAFADMPALAPRRGQVERYR